MRWNRILDSSQAFSAHTSLFCFTLLLVLKLDHLVSYSWWVVFFPLFVFHVILARRRSSSRGPFVFHALYVAPSRVPLLIVFELLLYVFLDYNLLRTVSLKIVFLPLFAFEVTIFYDNIRMCKALLSEHDEISSDAIWHMLPHFWVAISMVFFGIGTVFTLKKLCGEPNSLDWWNLFLYFGIAECFVFLVSTKWCNPVIHSGMVRYTEDISENMMCGLQDTYGCFMKILIICFQILLCMRFEGKPAAARSIPLPVVFSPVFLVQGLGVLFAALNLWDKIVILLYTRTDTGIYAGRVVRAPDTVDSLQHGSRLGPRSTGSRGEQTRINCNGSSRYNTFSTYPRENVKTFPKKERTEITESSQQNNDENLCTICYDKEINTVLLPCRHRILCSVCGEKCQKCPICRVMIGKRLAVSEVTDIRKEKFNFVEWNWTNVS